MQADSLLVSYLYDQIIVPLCFSLNEANISLIKIDTNLNEELAKLLRSVKGTF